MLLLSLLACPPKIELGPIAVEEAAAPTRIVEQPEPTAPNIYLQALIAAGSAYDPSGNEGLAALTARSMVQGGAGEHSSEQLNAQLYPLGTEFEVLVDREWVSLRLRCHVDVASTCVDLFADVLTAPRFEASVVERLRHDAVYQLSTGILSDEEQLGIETWDTWLHEAHPYGHPVSGRTGVLPTLSPQMVADFYHQHVVRQSVIAGIGGAFTAAQRDRLAERLQALSSTRAPELVLQRPLPVHGRHLLAVQTETAVTGFSLGHSLPLTRDHDDYPSLLVAMTALGAHRQSFGRLFEALRTERGLNYGTYAYVEPFVQRGWTDQPENGVLRRQPHFRIWVRPTSLDNGPFALKLTLLELERLVENGLSPAELAATKTALSKGVGLQARDPGRRLAYALDAEATGMPNPLTTLPSRLEAVDEASVSRALSRWIHPENLRIVAVTGNSDDLVSRLIEEIDTPIVYADVEPSPNQAELDATAAAYSLGIAPTDAHTVTVQGIFR